MYLNWSTPIYYSSRLIGSYGENEGDYDSDSDNFDYLSLYDTTPFSAQMDKPTIYFKEKHERLIKFDCLWMLGGQLLVSKKFKAILNSLTSSRIEYIEPAVIYTRDNSELNDYYIIKLLDEVSAIDHENSVSVYSEDNHFLYYNERCFKINSKETMLLAREALSREIVITKDLADTLSTCDIKVYSGFGFYTINPLTEYKTKIK
jgi:hypothetical protein